MRAISERTPAADSMASADVMSEIIIWTRYGMPPLLMISTLFSGDVESSRRAAAA